MSLGGVRKRVEDAKFNIHHGRYEAALALLLIAIDGSARKVYPKDFKSLKNPKKDIGNRERYTRFLGVRIRQLFGVALDDDAYFHGDLPQFVGGIESPEDKIYVGFRCNELHESQLPSDLQYAYDPKGIDNKLSLEFSNGKVHFSSGFLSLLEAVIVGAPCNGKEFGIHYYRLRPTGDVSLNEYINEISQRYGISPGRISILKELVQFIGPDVMKLSDKDLTLSLTKYLDERMPRGARTGLCTAGTAEEICTWDGGITSFGLQIVRDMLQKVKLEDIT